jgi:hypothetical protein
MMMMTMMMMMMITVLFLLSTCRDTKRKWALRKDEVVSSAGPGAYQTLVAERESEQRQREKELDAKEKVCVRANKQASDD